MDKITELEKKVDIYFKRVAIALESMFKLIQKTYRIIDDKINEAYNRMADVTSTLLESRNSIYQLLLNYYLLREEDINKVKPILDNDLSNFKKKVENIESRGKFYFSERDLLVEDIQDLVKDIFDFIKKINADIVE